MSDEQTNEDGRRQPNRETDHADRGIESLRRELPQACRKVALQQNVALAAGGRRIPKPAAPILPQGGC